MSHFRLNRIVLGLTLFCLLLKGGTVYAQTNQIALEAYRELVSETQVVVDSVRAASTELAASQLTSISEQWETIQEVVLPDGQILPIDTSYLVRILRLSPPDLDLVEAQLSSLVALAENWPEYVYGLEEVASVEQILQQPEYQWPEEEPSLLQPLIDKINQWLSKLFEREPNDQGLSEPVVIDLRWLYTLVSALFVGGILYFVLRDTIGALISETELENDRDGKETLTSDRAFGRAQHLSEQGDHRTAVRFLYLSALLLLEEKGILYYDRSKTNTEYVESVSSHPELKKSLRKVVGIFDRVWYGFRKIDEGTFKEYQQEVERLRKQR